MCSREVNTLMSRTVHCYEMGINSSKLATEMRSIAVNFALTIVASTLIRE
jgi:hypothetical protein